MAPPLGHCLQPSQGACSDDGHVAVRVPLEEQVPNLGDKKVVGADEENLLFHLLPRAGENDLGPLATGEALPLLSNHEKPVLLHLRREDRRTTLKRVEEEGVPYPPDLPLQVLPGSQGRENLPRRLRLDLLTRGRLKGHPPQNRFQKLPQDSGGRAGITGDSEDRRVLQNPEAEGFPRRVVDSVEDQLPPLLQEGGDEVFGPR